MSSGLRLDLVGELYLGTYPRSSLDAYLEYLMQEVAKEVDSTDFGYNVRYVMRNGCVAFEVASIYAKAGTDVVQRIQHVFESGKGPYAHLRFQRQSFSG